MKKVISILTVFIFLLVANAKAQYKYELEDVIVSSVKAKEGANTVRVPNNRGTIKFTKRGTTISNVIYTDAAGKSTNLQPTNGTANGAPQPNCKCPLPDACFGTANKNIGMCICKPCNISNGGDDSWSIALLLPAVQKVREAASRN